MKEAFDKDEYSIYSEFNLEKHMNTFINYLEVIMLPNGKIEYAVPSHQEKLISLLMKNRKWTRNQVEQACPKEYYCDYITWLLKETRCLAIWTHGYIGNPNRLQKRALKKLKENGLLN